MAVDFPATRDMGGFRSDAYPSFVPAGLCFIDLSGSCLVQTVSLSTGTYRLSFRYFQDYTIPERITVAILDSTTPLSSSMLSGFPTTINLRNNVYIYKKFVFDVSGSISSSIVICNSDNNGFTGVTGVHLKLEIDPNCNNANDQAK